MKPAQLIEQLTEISQQARHHPRPGHMVAILAQLVLDLATELQPIAAKYGVILAATGALDNIEQSVTQAAAELEATASGQFDQAQDTTGTAG